ncbi:MAG: leucine-rich repeat-containing protein kinase family protein [Caulobacteraceae bacterium]
MTTTLEALRRGELAGARELRLAGLGLTEFPLEIFGLADTLEVLDLSGNALTRLPDDFARLGRLRVLFCSGNRFDRLPPVLGDCAALSQVGFRATGLSDVPAEALPPQLRWLTLTDNRIERLPAALGERPALQKVMLAGNRLSHLPDSLAGAAKLELLRLAANRFEALPGLFTDLPCLAWLAWAGNPLDRALVAPASPQVAWTALRPGRRLGEGASGHVYAAEWRRLADAPARPVALKLFKGAMTSDGLPEREMAASLAAGDHPNLIGALGEVVGHPDQAQGLVMPLLPPSWRVLAATPSLESCSRDVYAAGLQLDLAVALRIAQGVGAAVEHLHARGLCHGDVYGHNILWDEADGAAMLSDFGAASFLPPGEAGTALQRLEVRAFGLLLGELLALCEEAASPSLTALQQACVQSTPGARPLMADVMAALG